MEHFLIMIAPPLIIALAVVVLFLWFGRAPKEREDERGSA